MSFPFANDHAAFQSLVFNHFRKLENQTETWAKLRADFEHEIARKDDLISTQQDAVRELERQLVEARRINAQLQEGESKRKESVLQPSSDHSLSDQENSTSNVLRSLKEITPPQRPAKLRRTATSATTDSEKAALERTTVSIAVETDPWEPATDREKALLEKYELAQKEASTYREAHRELLEKYTASKESWQQWTQVYQKDKKSKRRGPTTVPDRTRTPVLTERVPSPPLITPMKSNRHKEVDAEAPVRRGDLFSKRPATVRASSFSGFGSDSNGDDGMRQSAPPSLRKEDSLTSEPPATAEIPPTPDMDPSSHKNIAVQAPAIPNTDFEQPETSDAEDPREGSLTPKPLQIKEEEPQLPEISASTPRITRKRYSDGTQASPVVIKSEPASSGSEGPGYFVHDDDVDLDDVDQPERKKPRRSSQRATRASQAKSNKQAPELSRAREPLGLLEHTNEELPPPRNPLAAMAPKKRNGHARAVTPDAPTDDENLPPSPKPSASKKSTRTPYTTRRRKGASTSAARTPKATSPVKKPSTAKKNSDKYNVTAAVLADGTDGVGSVVKTNGPPDIHTPVVLGNILTTPAPKNPTLRNIAHNDAGTTTTHSSSVPPKRRTPWGGDGFVDEDVSGAPSVATPQPSTRTTRSTRHAQTDPPRHGKNSSDIPTTAEDALASMRKTKASNGAVSSDRPLTISDFKVNPAMNQGLGYAFKETVRRKEEKRCLPSCTKSCCHSLNKFVDAAGLPKASKGPRWRATGSSQAEGPAEDEEDTVKEMEREFLERYGRHKDTFGGLGRRPSPPGFWESDFPDTQEVKKRNEEADRLDRIRVEQLRKEAEKGAKGRYIYKGR